MCYDLNHLFCTKSLYAKYNTEDHRLPETVIPYATVLKQDRNEELSRKQSRRDNKNVLGLTTTITKELFDSEDNNLGVNNITRYSVQVTDDAFNKIVVNTKKVANKVTFTGRSLAINEKDGTLYSYEESGLSNEIDVESLILTRDGYWLVAVGTNDHPLNEGKVVPSIAGSLLPEELDNKTIQECMISSIHNKIQTSFNLPVTTTMRSSFCGYSRIIARGGAPEFYCITYIDATRDELIKAQIDKTIVYPIELFGLVHKPVEFASSNTATATSMVNTINTIWLHADNKLSTSAAALYNAITNALANEDTRNKIFHRLKLPVSKTQQQQEEENK
jgi:hypothetical protein